MGKGPRSSDTSTESNIGRNITRSMTIVRFRSCGTVGYWPTENQKDGDMLCDLVARFVREQFVSYVSNKVGTKGEGKREPFFLLVKMRQTNRQGSRPLVVTERSSKKVTSVQTFSTPKCLHKQRII